MANRLIGSAKTLVRFLAVLGVSGTTSRRARRIKTIRETHGLNARLELLLATMPVNLWSTDENLTITFSKGGGLKNVGISPDSNVGKPLTEILGTSDRSFFPLEAHYRALAGEPMRYETEWRGRAFETRIEPLRDDAGAVIGTVGLAVDVTERRSLDSKLQTQSVYFAELFESAPEAIVILDEHDRVQRINSEFTRMFGYTAQEAVGQLINDLIVPDELHEEGLTLSAVVAGGEKLQREVLRRRKDGTTVWVSISARPFKVGDEPIRVYGMYHDISDRKHAEEELRALSLVDSLTGLPNRRAFITLSDQALKWAVRSDKEVLLIFIDVDNLKQINDSCGHLSGDRALMDTARVLRETFREADIVARLAGDEFIALVTADAASAGELIIQRIEARLKAHNEQEERPYKLSLSIGTTHAKAEGSNLLELMELADSALYEKKRGRTEPRHAVSR